MIAPVAVLVPFAAEKAYRQFVGAQLDFSDPSRALRSASPEAVAVAVKSVFDVALTQSRFTAGALHTFGDALKRLLAKQLDAAATALAADLRAGKSLDAASLGKVTGSTHEFLVGANRAGLSASEAKAAAQVVRNAVTKGLPGAQTLTLAESSVSSAGLFTVSKVLSGLGGLGSVASLLSSGRSVHDAQESFKEGDETGGGLTGASAVASGVVGIGATVGTLFGVAALSGPLLPAVAVGAAVVGIVAAGWNYFHQKHRHEQQVNEQKQFLQGGVGNGHNYLAIP